MVAANEKTPWQGRGRLENLVAELNRQRETKLDFVADARNLMVVAGEKELVLAPADAIGQEWLPASGLRISDNALPQFGNRLDPDIPTKFLRELTAKRTGTASTLVNDLFQSEPKRHFIRCLDGKVRACLSNSYRVLDNYDLAFAALDVARANDGEVIEASLSDKHMRLKFTTRAIWDAVNEKDGGTGNHEWIGRTGWGGSDNTDLPGGQGTVHPLVTISNSETGHGGLRVQLGILRRICVNSAIIEDVQARIHLGDKLETGIYTEETLAADSKAIMLKCRDAIKAAFTKERFAALIAKVQGAADDKVARPREALENIVTVGGLTDAANDAILEYFLGDYDRNRYGLAQAVSRYAQDVDDPDEAFAVEELAGKVMVGAVALA